MTNKEAIVILRKYNMGYRFEDIQRAINIAIRALKTVEQIKQAIDKHDFPEYLEEDVIDIIANYYRDEKPLIKTELSKYPLCNARDEALCCEMTKGGFCSFAGSCPNKGRRIRQKMMEVDNENKA